MDRLILSEELIITKVSPTSSEEGRIQQEIGDGTNWSLDIEPVYLSERNRIDELNSPTVGTTCEDSINCFQSVSPASLCIATLSPRGEEPDSTTSNTWDNQQGRGGETSIPGTTSSSSSSIVVSSLPRSVSSLAPPLGVVRSERRLPPTPPRPPSTRKERGGGKKRRKKRGGEGTRSGKTGNKKEGDLNIKKEELVEDLDGLFPKIEPVPGNVVYPCPTCGLTFSTLAYVQQHSKWCRGSRSRSNRKGGVGQGSVLAGSPRVKEERDGEGGEEREGDEEETNEEKKKKKKKYPCSVCPYSTDVSSHLTAHLRRHTGERPFACSLCPYRAAEACTLARHRLAHSGARPYACPLCPHRAAFAGDLQKHLRRHTGERPFACLECPYRAARPGSLKEHVLSQHESRSFTCSVCPWSGSGPSQLRKHCRTAHRGGGSGGGGASGGGQATPQDPPEARERNLFPCYLCRHDSSQLRDLTRHIQTSHPQLVSLYKPGDD